MMEYYGKVVTRGSSLVITLPKAISDMEDLQKDDWVYVKITGKKRGDEE